MSGTNLRGASKVQFGAGHTAGAFTVNSAGTVITVTAPAGTGVVDVIVTTGSGASAATPFDRFTYVPPGPYDGATLTLSPSSSGPDVPHTTQSLTATLQDRSGHALPDMPVAWTVGGANHASGTAATDATGVAHFSYTGTLSGADTVTAQVAAGRSPISSNPATVTWAVPTAPLASLSTSSVSGSFFAESPSATAFVAKPGDLAAFAESFPDITFNPPASTVPHDTSKVGPATVPFTDVTTDGLGNFTGTRAAQGNGLAAGAGALTAFDAEFEGTFTVAAAGQATLAVAHDDGFILGVGGGATKVSGPAIGAPATTPFKGYAVMGAVNQVEAAPLTDTVVVNFPAAGTYSYELDYLQRTATMSLVLGFPGAGGGGGGGGGGGSSLTISAAYAYGAGTGANFPTPWSGSPGVTFSGSAAAPYDTGALRFDNTGASTVQLADVSVDIGAHHYDPGAGGLTVPAGGTAILAGADSTAFDTSESSLTSGGCPPLPVLTGNGAPDTVVGSNALGQNGYATQSYSTGFPTGGVGGPYGMAFDACGNLFVNDVFDGHLYEVAPGGAAPTQLALVGAGLTGLAFSHSGRLYATYGGGNIVELSTTTGAIIRQVTLINEGLFGLAFDPLSGDLFAAGTHMWRVSGVEGAGPAVASQYGAVGADGIAFSPDGTLYGAGGGTVEAYSGTDRPQPATLATVVTGLANPDGIAVLAAPPGQPATRIVTNNNIGTVTLIDLSTSPPTKADIVAGGSRGDMGTTGPDGCFYASQSTIVMRVSNADGTCPFVPTSCIHSTDVPHVHVTIGTQVTSVDDTHQVLNTSGVDGDSCGGVDESQPWQQLGSIGGGGGGGSLTPVVPLPPGDTMVVAAGGPSASTVGQPRHVSIAVTDAVGQPVAGLAVTVDVVGANTQALAAVTDATGVAHATYTGLIAGTDTVAAFGFPGGLRVDSNVLTLTWAVPVPGGPVATALGPAPPYISVLAPADGASVGSPTAVSALVNPPASSPIASWSVTAQNTGGGAVIPLNSGAGAPPTNVATFDPTGLASGTYAIVVSATTAAGDSAQAVVHVLVGTSGGGSPGQAPPVITITAPTEGSTVTAPTPVTATITPPTGQTIATWAVSLRDTGGGALRTLANGAGAPPATLTTLDPTLLVDGAYNLVVSATTAAGGAASAAAGIAVNGALKLGRYTETFTDVTVPIAGFTLGVQRVYDSTDKTPGAFGVGWHDAVAGFRVATNGPLGAGGWYQYRTSCSFGVCNFAFSSTNSHFVTVTFPDGHDEVFDFTPAGGAALVYAGATVAFTGRPGTATTSTLAPLAPTTLTDDLAGDLLDNTGRPYAPTRFQLTTATGRTLVLDTVTGLVSETDPDGNSLAVDSSGVHAFTGPQSAPVPGPSIHFSRDASGRITGVTDPNGNVWTYSYSPVGDLVRVAYPGGSAIDTYTYDASHNLLSQTGPGAPALTETYDPVTGRLKTIQLGTQPPVTISSSIGPGAATQTFVSPTGITTIDTFDARGDLVSESQSDGTTTRTTAATYDAAGNALSVADPAGQAQHATYDSLGHLTSFTDGLGRVSTFTYNTLGNLTSATDPLGVQTVFTYDSTGNQLTRSDPLGTQSNTYDAAGNQLTSVDELGRVTHRSFDTVGHLLSVTDPLGDTTVFTYDSDGHELTATDPLGNVHSRTYDTAGRPVAFTDPLGRSSTAAYDADGRVSAVTTPRGSQTTYSYDAAGNLVGLHDALGGVVSMTHDAAGRVTTITDPDGHAATFGYDAFGDETRYTSPSGASNTILHDADGRVTQVTNALGQSVTYSYDAAGELISVASPGRTSTRSFDADGRLVDMADSVGTTAFAYDVRGHQLAKTSPAGSLAYVYDAAGERTAMIINGTATTSYSHDAAGDVVSIVDPLGNATQLGYDAAGRPVSITRPDGVVTNDAFDASGQVSSVVTRSPSNVLASENYTRDADGNPTSMVTPLGTETASYDALDRLTSVTYANATTESFTYDAAGNRTSDTVNGATTNYTYDPSGRLATVGPNAYHYDGAGNLTGAGPDAFSWDVFGDLTSATIGGVTTSYTYDGNGSRVGATGGTSARYVWDTTGSVPQLVSDGSSLYIGSGTADEQITGTTTSSYLPDALGSVVAVEAGGALTGSTTYGAFGNVMAQTGAKSALGFTGALTDSTGLPYLHARVLDPATGRFLSADSVDPSAPSTTGFNLSTYAEDEPLLLTDRNGHGGFLEYDPALQSATILATAAAGAIGGAVTASKNCQQKDFGTRLNCTVLNVFGGAATALIGLAFVVWAETGGIVLLASEANAAAFLGAVTAVTEGTLEQVPLSEIGTKAFYKALCEGIKEKLLGPSGLGSAVPACD